MDIQEGYCSQEPPKNGTYGGLKARCPIHVRRGQRKINRKEEARQRDPLMIVVLPSLGNRAPGIRKTGKKNRPASFASQHYSPQYLLLPNQVVRSRSPSLPRYRDRFKTKTIGWLKTSEKDKENNRNNCPLQGYYFAHISSHWPTLSGPNTGNLRPGGSYE